ncbi:MAG: hypothetical protein WDN04_27155 [Rhodospirillales bacterium]
MTRRRYEKACAHDRGAASFFRPQPGISIPPAPWSGPPPKRWWSPDLHLEKGSAAARAGQLVPPWDSRHTLERLALLLRRYQPRTVIALGDSFHDDGGPARLAAGGPLPPSPH